MKSQLQLQVDELSYNYLRSEKRMRLQSICDFNIFSMDSIFNFREEPIDFLVENIPMFKRKLSLREFSEYEQIIYWQRPKDFKSFTMLIRGDFSNENKGDGLVYRFKEASSKIKV